MASRHFHAPVSAQSWMYPPVPPLSTHLDWVSPPPGQRLSPDRRDHADAKTPAMPPTIAATPTMPLDSQSRMSPPPRTAVEIAEGAHIKHEAAESSQARQSSLSISPYAAPHSPSWSIGDDKLIQGEPAPHPNVGNQENAAQQQPHRIKVSPPPRPDVSPPLDRAVPAMLLQEPGMPFASQQDKRASPVALDLHHATSGPDALIRQDALARLKRAQDSIKEAKIAKFEAMQRIKQAQREQQILQEAFSNGVVGSFAQNGARSAHDAGSPDMHATGVAQTHYSDYTRPAAQTQVVQHAPEILRRTQHASRLELDEKHQKRAALRMEEMHAAFHQRRQAKMLQNNHSYAGPYEQPKVSYRTCDADLVLDDIGSAAPVAELRSLAPGPGRLNMRRPQVLRPRVLAPESVARALEAGALDISWERQVASKRISATREETVEQRPRVGLGVAVIRDLKGLLRVTRIVPGYAAHKSEQVRINDVVEAIDGEQVEGMDLTAVRRLLVGLEGTMCSLRISRQGISFAFTIYLIRELPAGGKDALEGPSQLGHGPQIGGSSVGQVTEPNGSMPRPVEDTARDPLEQIYRRGPSVMHLASDEPIASPPTIQAHGVASLTAGNVLRGTGFEYSNPLGDHIMYNHSVYDTRDPADAAASSGSSPPLAYFQTQGMLGGQDARSQWGFHTSMPQPAVIT